MVISEEQVGVQLVPIHISCVQLEVQGSNKEIS